MNLIARPLRVWLATLVIVSMCVMEVAPAAAGLAPSHVTGATAIATVRDADMLVAQRALEYKVVAQKLHDYGLTPADAQLRLASMSDGDLHTLASASKGLPSGGDSGGLIGVLVVVVLVLVILKLMNRDVVVR